MDERATGIILRTRPLTETSLIVNWLTPEFGRISTVAKGALRQKSNFRGKLDLFYLADFSFQRSRRSDLHNLREVNLLETNTALRGDLTFLQQVSYCAKLVEQTTEVETPITEIYTLMCEFVVSVSLHAAQPLMIFAFEIKLLQLLGMEPNYTEAKLSAGSRQILQRAMNSDWTSLSRLKLSAPQVHEISQFLHGFIVYHCSHIPSGRPGALLIGN
jgi:DNA repair protein RecO (recombination protein O)